METLEGTFLLPSSTDLLATRQIGLSIALFLISTRLLVKCTQDPFPVSPVRPLVPSDPDLAPFWLWETSRKFIILGARRNNR